MPVKMGATVQSIVFGNTLYVGGGEASNEVDMYTVMKLDLTNNQWTKLPQYTRKRFALVSFANKLMLVGGTDAKSNTSGLIAVFSSNNWEHLYPPMRIARSNTTAVSTDNHIIVVGGRDDQEKRTASVEVLDVNVKKWHTADPLPSPRASIKSTLVGRYLYIMGGWDHTDSASSSVHSIDIDKLVENACMSQDTPSSNIWQEIRDAIIKRATPIGVDGYLFAVGGRDDSDKPSSSVYVYKPETKIWEEVGSLPSPRYYCACSALPTSGDIIVAGGQTTSASIISKYLSSKLLTSYVNTVDILSIC